MRYTLVREQNSHIAISVGVRPAAHNKPYRACRNSANIHSCSCRGIFSMVELCTVGPPQYLGGIATLEIPKRSLLCQSHASWFSDEKLAANCRRLILTSTPPYVGRQAWAFPSQGLCRGHPSQC